jgi:sugar lactone lactonase YvrE
MTSFTIAAQTPKQLAGVTISNTGRLFINFPRWVDVPTPSVAEVAADGSLVPYPNAELNEWDLVPGESAANHFVCVQSVVADGDTLWILDPASPMFAAVVPGGAKLLNVSLTTNKVEHIYHFDDTAAPVQSYLNDVRIAFGSAFMSDSGLGAIVVVNLATGNVRRLLEHHPSTKAEPGLDVIIGGHEWKFSSNHTTPQVNTDGIAIDPKLEYVYYKALTARTLYRVPVAALLDESAPPDRFVERVAVTEPTDGLECDADGNLYLTSLQDNAIKILRPDGRYETFATAPEFLWPDTITMTNDGALLFSASQFHRMPLFHDNVDQRQPPYHVFRVPLRQP